MTDIPKDDRYFPQEEVPDHQILLTFNTDDGAYNFHTWLWEVGMPLYEEWYKENVG